MGFLEKLNEQQDHLTKTEQRISDYILAHPFETARCSITELADMCNASRSAIVRFSQKLGYTTYREFRYEFSLFVHTGVSIRQGQGNKIEKLVSYYERAIHDIPQYVDERTLDAIAQAMAHAPRIKIFGLNRNTHSAMQLRHHLHRINVDAEAVSDTALVRDLSAAGEPGDVHVYFSVSGDTPIVRDAIGSSQAAGATTVLITTRANAPMAPYATILVLLPSTMNYTHEYFFDQQAINYVFIELIIVYLSSYLETQGAQP